MFDNQNQQQGNQPAQPQPQVQQVQQSQPDEAPVNLDPMAAASAPLRLDTQYAPSVPTSLVAKKEFEKGITDPFESLTMGGLEEVYKFKNESTRNKFLLLVTSAGADISLLALEGLSKIDDNVTKKLTPQEYKDSQYYFPGAPIDKNGIYIDLAKVKKIHYDTQANVDALDSAMTPGIWKDFVEGGSYLGGAVVNPLNYIFDGVPRVLELGETAVHAAQISRISNDAIRGLLEKTVDTGVTSGAIGAEWGASGYIGNKEIGKPASLKMIALNALIGTGLGTGGSLIGSAIGHVISSRMPKLESDFAKDNDLNANVTDGSDKADVAVSPVSEEAHQTMLKVAMGQIENDKPVDIETIAKQARTNQWEKNFGDELASDPDKFRDVTNEIKSRLEENKNNLLSINDEITRLNNMKEGLEDTSDIDDELFSLNTDKEKINKSIADQSSLIEMRENIPEDVSMNELRTKIGETKQQDSTNIEQVKNDNIPDMGEIKEPLQEGDKEKFVDSFHNFWKDKLNIDDKDINKAVDNYIKTGEFNKIDTNYKEHMSFIENVKKCLMGDE